MITEDMEYVLAVLARDHPVLINAPHEFEECWIIRASGNKYGEGLTLEAALRDISKKVENLFDENYEATDEGEI